ncbi:cell division cycle protein 45 [Choristoneura fumiferana]|uniref:cell division cycle protein 45 n=1 Tax=Choristoneura fumiferana TaxID=7141 RepID=UPI003D155015
MFVENLKNDFYNVLLGSRVLLLVHYDVDAICTCKILQGLFKCDNISYTLVPVGGISELKQAYDENNDEIKYVCLVNCGGTIDLVDILQPEEDVVFFVLDCHKPSHICNVYSEGQVRMVYKDEEEKIPDFEDIFRDDEDEDEEEPSEGGREALEAMVERRRARRAWEERRDTLMFNYTQFSYFGKPSALVALDVCWLVSRLGLGAGWAAAVAGAAHEAWAARGAAASLLDAGNILRANTHTDHAAEIVLEQDVCLPLYRSWSLEAALRHSPAVGPHLQLHSLAGAARLRQLLADMGFPLQQARQSYRSMDVELRRGLLEALERAAGERRLRGVTRASHALRRPPAPPRPALDLVYAVGALLHHETIPRSEGFQLALSALEIEGDNESLRIGIAAAQRSLECVARLVNATLAARALHLAGPFTYFIVHEGTPDAWAVSSPLWLGWRRAGAAAANASVPPPQCRALVASAPLPGPGPRCLLLGLPPRAQQPANLFGAAFSQAAAKSGVSVSMDYIDSSVISLPTAQRAQFLDALTALMG